MKSGTAIYGLMAEFETHEQLLDAARRAHEIGYRRMDGYAPFPIEGLPEALGRKRTLVPLVVLLGGIVGGLGGYFMEWYASVVSYPINVGGRPLHSWPSFIPITFELTVLGAALSAFFGSLAMNKLPQPYHPVFNVPDFERASIDRFFLCIEASDPKFDLAETRKLLEGFEALRVAEVDE
jgi:ActD protein